MRAQHTLRYRPRGLRVAATIAVAAMLTCLCSGSVLAKKKGGGHGHKPVAVSEFRPLKFGKVAGSSDGPGTVTIAPSGTKSVSGYAIDFGGNSRAAEFKVTGDAGTVVDIYLPTSNVTVTNRSGQTTILHSFTSDPSGTGTLNNKGKLTIEVGATMDLPAGQTGGKYTGSFTIDVVDPLNP